VRDRIALLAFCQVVLLIAGCARQPEPSFSLGARTVGLKSESWEGFDPRLVPSLNDASGIPTEGKGLIVVAAVKNVLHFRIIDGRGNVVVDTDERRLTEHARQIEDLRKQLEGLWPPRELTASDKDQVAKAVTSIVGHNLQEQIRRILSDYCGRPLAPKLLGTTAVSSGRTKRGAEVYSRYCVQCHGVNGDGNGVAAQYLIPKPRNYTMGIFKFTSTTYGYKPLREDLIRTVKRGIRGTSMPAFSLLSRSDLESVVDYVISLARRGELESKLADQAEFDEKVDEQALPEVIADIVGKWDAANSQVIYPATPMPIFKQANIDAGKQAFLSNELGCFKCHGPDGRGMLASNVGTDAWGNPTKAADLTSGMLRGGTEPLDIYRHIDAGINGTPMPSFRDVEKLKAEPQTIWNLISYVLDVADIRRRGVTPDSGYLENGMLKPLPGVKPAAAAAPPAPPAAPAGTHTTSRSENASRVAAR
jgi:mono/diheme cytochrome c family protein